jgi:hypothetical protein
MKAFLRTLSRVAIWATAGVAAFLLAALILVQTPFFRAEIARRLVDLINGQISGRLAIGRIESLSLNGLIARDLALFDLQGVRVVSADRLLLGYNPLRLWSGTLLFDKAVLERPFVRLYPGQSGDPTFLEIFTSPQPVSAPSATPLHVIVEGIAVSDATIYGQVVDLKGLRAEQLQARGRLESHRTLEISIYSLTGRVVRPFPFTGIVEELTGTISSDSGSGMRLRSQLARPPDRAAVTLIYARSASAASGRELELTIGAARLSPDTLRGLGFDWIAPVKTPLAGTVQLRGPPSELSLSAAITTLAGDAQVYAHFSTNHGTELSLRTKELDLEKAIISGPPVSVAGQAYLQIGAGATAPYLDLQLEPLVYHAIALPAVRVRGWAESDRFRMDLLSSRGSRGTISGRGYVTYSGGLNLAVSIAIDEIAREPNVKRHVPDARGALRAKFAVSMPDLRVPRGNLESRVVLSRFSYGIFDAERLELSGRAQGDLELPRLDLRVSGSSVAVNRYALGDIAFDVRGDRTNYRAVGKVALKGKEAFHLESVIRADKKSITANADTIELFLGDRSWRGIAQNFVFYQKRVAVPRTIAIGQPLAAARVAGRD